MLNSSRQCSIIYALRYSDQKIDLFDLERDHCDIGKCIACKNADVFPGPGYDHECDKLEESLLWQLLFLRYLRTLGFIEPLAQMFVMRKVWPKKTVFSIFCQKVNYLAKKFTFKHDKKLWDWVLG